jgi:hypothetical protein
MRPRIIASIVLAICLTLGTWTVYTPPCLAGSCGILPIKPIVPLGCRDLCPQCQCDPSGQSCWWVWVCC